MRILKDLSAFLANRTSMFVILVAVFTFFVPETFAWVKGNTQTIVLGIIMLSMGMTLSVNDFRILAKHPVNILVGAVAQYSLMPLIAFMLVRVVDLNPGIAVGLILVGCCPGGVSSNIMSFLCHGDVAFSVGMTTVTTLLSPVLTPLLVLALAGKSIPVDAVAMFKSILWVTLLPVGVGFMANLIWNQKPMFKDIQAVMPGISVLGLACIVGGVITYNGSAFFTSGVTIFVAILLHNGLGYLAGYLTGSMLHMGIAQRRTISIEVGMQNAGLATNLASKHFSAMPEVAVASAVSCVWHSISGTLLAGWFLQRDTKKLKLNKTNLPKEKVTVKES